MSPFWAEFFDVGINNSADEPSLACDFEPSSQGSVMMIVLLLFLQKQNLAFAVYLLGSVLSLPD
jgi:hypothetical protein